MTANTPERSERVELDTKQTNAHLAILDYAKSQGDPTVWTRTECTAAFVCKDGFPPERATINRQIGWEVIATDGKDYCLVWKYDANQDQCTDIKKVPLKMIVNSGGKELVLATNLEGRAVTFEIRSAMHEALRPDSK